MLRIEGLDWEVCTVFMRHLRGFFPRLLFTSILRTSVINENSDIGIQ